MKTRVPSRLELYQQHQQREPKPAHNNSSSTTKYKPTLPLKMSDAVQMTDIQMSDAVRMTEATMPDASAADAPMYDAPIFATPAPDPIFQLVESNCGDKRGLDEFLIGQKDFFNDFLRSSKHVRTTKMTCGLIPSDAIKMLGDISTREYLHTSHNFTSVPRGWISCRLNYRLMIFESTTNMPHETREDALRDACEHVLLWIYCHRPRGEYLAQFDPKNPEKAIPIQVCLTPHRIFIESGVDCHRQLAHGYIRTRAKSRRGGAPGGIQKRNSVRPLRVCPHSHIACGTKASPEMAEQCMSYYQFQPPCIRSMHLILTSYAYRVQYKA